MGDWYLSEFNYIKTHQNGAFAVHFEVTIEGEINLGIAK